MSSTGPIRFVQPMKATSTAPPPDNGLWLYEVKFDGLRALAVKNGPHVELWSRNEKPLGERFPSIVAAIKKLSVRNCLLDGEICALDPKGQSSFQLLQHAADGKAPIVYYPFDLLFRGRNDLRSSPLWERKRELEKVLIAAAPPLLPSSCFITNPAKILHTMRLAGVEGAIAKLKDSAYSSGHRSTDWIKIKFHKAQELIIVGYTLPKNSRSHFGSLILGYYSHKELVFAGRVGTGFDQKTLHSLYKKLQPLRCRQPQVQGFREPSGRWRATGWKPSESVWVRPQLVAQIQFTEWTKDGVLRHPSFQGLREDKNPREVVRE